MTVEAVRSAWLEFTEALEGGVPWMYADIRNLVTVAYGNLIDPVAMALPLPFEWPNGAKATEQEIRDAWNAIKSNPNAAKRGHLYAKGLTQLALSKEGMGLVAIQKFDANNAILKRRLPDFDSYPSCAQMALHSLAWACGPYFNFGKLIACVQARDWQGAAVSIHINEYTPEGAHNVGLVPRNKRNKMLMLNASRVESYVLDPDCLDWETLLEIPTKPEIEERDTEPTLPTGTVYPAPIEAAGIISALPGAALAADLHPDDRASIDAAVDVAEVAKLNQD